MTKSELPPPAGNARPSRGIHAYRSAEKGRHLADNARSSPALRGYQPSDSKADTIRRGEPSRSYP